MYNLTRLNDLIENLNSQSLETQYNNTKHYDMTLTSYIINNIYQLELLTKALINDVYYLESIATINELLLPIGNDIVISDYTSIILILIGMYEFKCSPANTSYMLSGFSDQELIILENRICEILKADLFN